MNRIGIIIAFAVAGITGLIFAIWPELDLTISGLFVSPDHEPFYLRKVDWTVVVRYASMGFVAILAVPAGMALAGRLVRPQQRRLVGLRASLFLLTTLALGPGLLVNLALKDNWARPRPYEVSEFGGTDKFVPWWDARGTCRKNCSFVGGESASAFWTLAPAALAPAPWRPLAYAGALAFGAGVGTMRIVLGGHFFTDVVFSGVLVFLVIWVVHGLIYRWDATRLSEDAVEAAIARLSGAMRRLGRVRPPT